MLSSRRGHAAEAKDLHCGSRRCLARERKSWLIISDLFHTKPYNPWYCTYSLKNCEGFNKGKDILFNDKDAGGQMCICTERDR